MRLWNLNGAVKSFAGGGHVVPAKVKVPFVGELVTNAVRLGAARLAAIWRA